MNAAQQSIVVKAPIAKVYDRWLHGEEFPKFVTAIKTSRQLDPNHFEILEQLNGERHESVLEFVLRIPERKLVWRSLSDHLAAGVVTFTPNENRTTTVTLSMVSTYGGDVSTRAGAYLKNFKKLIENAPEAARIPGTRPESWADSENVQ
jgi:uncharacterized membrane protein